MNNKKRILLLEDDTILSQTMLQLLQQENYEVSLVEDGEEVLTRTYEEKFDLYLFDINVPQLNGTETLKLLRDAQDTTPTFFITALVDTPSILKGFDSGCDDYIKKPFDSDELLIRIKTVLKKRNPIIEYKDITFDLFENRVFKNKEEISLGSVEKNVFSLLIRNIGMTVDKTIFFEYMNKPTNAALRVLISKLKKVLDIEIENTKGVGYKLEKL